MHGLAVGAVAAAEQLELLLDVGGKLAGQAGKLAGQPGAVGAVTGRASRHAAIGRAGAPEFLAMLDEFFVARGGGLFQGLLRQIQGDVLDVRRRQGLAHGRHRRGCALRALAHRQLGARLDLEVVQLLGQILVRLGGQVGICGNATVAGRPMTGRTGNDASRRIALIEQLGAFGRIGLGGACGPFGSETYSSSDGQTEHQPACNHHPGQHTLHVDLDDRMSNSGSVLMHTAPDACPRSRMRLFCQPLSPPQALGAAPTRGDYCCHCCKPAIIQ